MEQLEIKKISQNKSFYQRTWLRSLFAYKKGVRHLKFTEYNNYQENNYLIYYDKIYFINPKIYNINI